MSVREHYNTLLGPIYSWTLGDLNARVQATATLLESLIGGAHDGKRAIDLGCGTGVQTLALSQLGFRVTGIDFSEEILKEYVTRTAAAPTLANAVQSDIAAFDVGVGYDAALCFGDTISHLQSWEAVRSTFACVHRALKPGGAFFLASRDHSLVYQGTDRFLLIRSDEIRSMICVLEDEGAHVRVTDLIQERHQDQHGPDALKASSYLKLRVSPETLKRELESAGLKVQHVRELSGGVYLFHALREAS
jgi:SAM-dependent methyltransferase